MKTFKAFILICLLAIPGFAQALNDSVSRKLDAYFSALTELKNFNGNVLIAQHEKVLLDKTYNMVGESDSLKINRESKFIIASVSKVFIKLGILKLQELKKLQLSDPLKKFIPDFPQGEKISLDNLLHHQSGLPRELSNAEAYDSLSLAQIVALAKSEKLQFEPGTQTLYSNVGYFLLHFIIDKASDEGYLKFIQKELLNQMNLSQTMEFNSNKSIPAFAYGFDKVEGKIVATDKKNINRFETGNYLSTLGDLYSLSKQILNGKVIKKELALELFKPDSLLIQAGGRPGYRAYFYMNLKTEVTFIFVSNYTDMPIQEATADVVNILANKSVELPHKVQRKEIQLPIETLKNYIGEYALEADLNQHLKLELIEGKLYNVESESIKTLLHADSETSFFEDAESKDGYVFTLNERTKEFELTIIQTGLKLKTKRLSK